MVFVINAAKGAEVTYKEPQWVKTAGEKVQQLIKKEEKEAVKPEGVKIRKRKPEIYRTIDLKLKL